MIGDARAIGSHRKSRYLAQYDKQELTIDTPYGARRVKGQVDATEIEISIIDPFAALWLITSSSGSISSDARGCHHGNKDGLPYIPTVRHNPPCPALGFLETISSDARPVFSMHVGIELTDGLQKYVFRAELDALVQHVQPRRGDV